MNPKRLICVGTWGLLVLIVAAAGAAEPSVTALIGKLTGGEESARLEAIDQLATRGAKAAAAVDPLTQLLKDGSAPVRAHAVRCLGEIGKPALPAVTAIAELVKDPDAAVRRQAVKAVMKLRPGPKVTIPLCVKLLEDPDPGVRVRVLHAITEAGPKALPGLIEALKNKKAAYWACLVLRDLGPAAKAAVPALTETLRDAQPDVRREAILALAAMDKAAAPAAEQIAAALSDEHTRVAATYALGRIGQIPADAEATIEANGKSDDKMLCTTSLWALALVHPENKEFRREATERLIDRLKDEDPFVRVAAARGLAALPPAPEITGPIWEKALQNMDEKGVQYSLDALARLGPPAVQRLIDALKYEKLRGHVVYVLGQFGSAAAAATPALAKLVADKDEHVAHEAILTLANIGPGAKGAVPSLMQALQQGAGTNAPAIAYALGRIGPDAAEAEPVLVESLGNSNRHLALASAWALVQIRPASAEIAAKTLPVLVAGLKTASPIGRRGAAEALGSLGAAAKEALPALKQASADKDPTVRAAAAKAVELIGAAATEGK